jgi:NADPH:quinone reductase-like Zn-dependent oxidoreductase
MKALYFEKTGEIENLRFAELPSSKQQLGSNQVRLKFLAGGLNHLDLWVLKGLPRVRYQFPHIAGADFCGEVVESNSPQWSLGQRAVVYPVVASTAPENLSADFKVRGENFPGVFCEELIVEASELFPLPTHLSAEEGAAFPLMYLTAWQMLVEKATLPISGKVIVHGAGSGVTHALLDLLTHFDVSSVAVTSRDEKKLYEWKAKGFTCFVASTNLKDELRSWVGQEGAAVIFDHIGEAYFEMNTGLLRRGGKFITCGATSGFEGRIDLRHLYFKQLQLIGSTMGSRKAFADLLGFIEAKRLKPRIGHEFELSNAPKGYTLMESGQQNGKIIFRMAP